MRFSFPMTNLNIVSYALERALAMPEKELSAIVGKNRAKEIREKRGETPVYFPRVRGRSK